VADTIGGLVAVTSGDDGTFGVGANASIITIIPNALQPETLHNLRFSITPASERDAALAASGIFLDPPAIAPDGALSFSLDPAAMFHGVIEFKVSASNNGSDAHGGVNTSDVAPFALIVKPVNVPPSFTLTPRLPPLLENSGA